MPILYLCVFIGVSIIIASLTGVPKSYINAFIAVFLIISVLIGLCYVFDDVALRGVIWAVGFIFILGFFIKSIVDV